VSPEPSPIRCIYGTISGQVEVRVSQYWGSIFNGDHLKNITYADDIYLINSTREDMSTLLACLQRFYTDYHVSVNVDKLKALFPADVA
jgi:hypothetical protein